MTRTRESSWPQAFLAAAIVGALTVLLFLPVSRGEFVWDDNGFLGVENRSVDQWSDVIRGFGVAVTPGASVAYYRPILTATFVLDYQLAGADPVRFRLTNVLLHGANAALVLAVLYLFTGSLAGAIAGSLLFAVHPIQGQAVGLVMGRNDELLLPPMAAMMIADEWGERRGRRGLAAILIAMAYAVALWTKETAIVAPALILLTDLLWRGRSWGDLGRRLPLLGLLAVVTALYFATRVAVLGAILDTGQYGTLGPLGRLALATATLGYYLRLLVLPTHFAPAPYYAGLVDPTGSELWVAAAVVALSTGLILFTLRRAPRVAYGLLFFVVASTPVLGLGSLMKVMMLEHRTYLPMLGIALSVAAFIAGTTSRAVQVTLAVALLGCAALTARRLPSYTTSLALWGMGVRNVPASDYSRNNYAAALMDADRYPEAVEQLREGLRLNPDYDRARYNLAGCLEYLGQRDQAIAELEILATRRPKDAAVLGRLGSMRSRAGELDQARQAFARAVELMPDDLGLRRNLYDVLARAGRHTEAAEQARRLAELQPNAAESWLRLGSSLRRAGSAAEAATAYERGIALGYDSGPLRLEIAAALWDAGRPLDAVPHAERARAFGVGDAPILQRLREAGLLDVPLSSGRRARDRAHA